MSAQAYAQKEAEEQEKARLWLENLLGLDVENDFFAALGDGVLLCSIVNTIKPGTVPKVFSAARCKKIITKKMDNINSFIAGARRIGVFSSYMIDAPEFAAGKRLDKLVRCLLKLEEIAKKAGIERGENVLALAGQIEDEDRKKREAIEAEIAAKEKAEREVHEAFERERSKRESEEKEWRDRKDKERKEMEAKWAQMSKEQQEEHDRKQREELEKRNAAMEEYKKQEEAKRNEREQKFLKEKEDREKRLEELKKKATTSVAASSPSRPQVLSGPDAIIYWAQQQTEGYSGVEVKDFTKSWKDGLAFCALVHSYFPKAINFEACKAKTPLERLALAFDVAGQQGVPPLLDAEDVWEPPTPDRRSMMTYLSCLYKGFKGR